MLQLSLLLIFFFCSTYSSLIVAVLNLLLSLFTVLRITLLNFTPFVLRLYVFAEQTLQYYFTIPLVLLLYTCVPSDSLKCEFLRSTSHVHTNVIVSCGVLGILTPRRHDHLHVASYSILFLPTFLSHTSYVSIHHIRRVEKCWDQNECNESFLIHILHT